MSSFIETDSEDRRPKCSWVDFTTMGLFLEAAPQLLTCMAVQASPSQVLSGSGDFWIRDTEPKQCLGLYHCDLDLDTPFFQLQTVGSYTIHRALFYVQVTQPRFDKETFDFVAVGCRRHVWDLWEQRDLQYRSYREDLYQTCILITRVALEGWGFRIDVLEAGLELVCFFCVLLAPGSEP